MISYICLIVKKIDYVFKGWYNVILVFEVFQMFVEFCLGLFWQFKINFFKVISVYFI